MVKAFFVDYFLVFFRHVLRRPFGSFLLLRVLEFKIELGADDDVLKHIHHRWNERPSQNGDVQVIFVEPQMGFPAKVDGFIAHHVVPSCIRLALH